MSNTIVVPATEFAPFSAVVPDGVEYSYFYANDDGTYTLVLRPEYAQRLLEERLERSERASRIAIQDALSTGDVDPEDIDAVAAIWPPVTVGETVRQGDLRYHAPSGKLLRAEQPTYTVREEDDPLALPAIWTVLGAPLGEGEVPEWRQPTGAQDAYQTGDEVSHPNAQDGGNVWRFRSNIDANTTEPGTDGTFHRWWEPVERL